MSTVDIDSWVKVDASILDLRQMKEACEAELERRPYVCGVCGQDIPTAGPVSHPAHDRKCLRYASMVTY